MVLLIVRVQWRTPWCRHRQIPTATSSRISYLGPSTRRHATRSRRHGDGRPGGCGYELRSEERRGAGTDKYPQPRVVGFLTWVLPLVDTPRGLVDMEMGGLAVAGTNCLIKWFQQSIDCF